MPRKLLLVIALSFLGATQVRSDRCSKRCECDDDEVICEGIDSIPQNLPESTVVLRIQDSPELTKVGRFDLDRYEDLRTLSFSYTGIGELDKKALSDLEKLRTFEIISASNIESFESGIFDENEKLEAITVRDCPLFSSLQDGIFGNIKSLEKLELMNNSIQSFSEGVLRDSPNVRTIDLSHNARLQRLPRFAFSNLTKLKTLALSSCQLEVLYPDHVKAPYESGSSLFLFDGRYNNWHCNEMCEFIDWTASVNHFDSVATMGLCSYPEYLQNRPVLSLESSDVCYSPSDAFIIILGVLFGSVLLLTCCFLLAARYCLGGLFSSRPTAAATGSRGLGENHRTGQSNCGFADTEGQRQTTDTANDLFQADCEVGGWNIGDIEPPPYDAVYKIKPNSNVCEEMEERDIETHSDHEDVAPPPYEEGTTA